MRFPLNLMRKASRKRNDSQGGFCFNVILLKQG
jgi:hypothetical protein